MFYFMKSTAFDNVALNFIHRKFEDTLMQVMVSWNITKYFQVFMLVDKLAVVFWACAPHSG